MARSDSVAVPQFEAAERRRAVFQTDLVEKHFTRCDDPRKISERYVTNLSYPAACTFVTRVEPVLRARVEDFAVWIACTLITTLSNHYTQHE